MNDKKFRFKDTDIDEKIILEEEECLYLCDLVSSFGVLSSGKLVLAYEEATGTGAALKLFSKPESILGGYGFFLKEEEIENFFFLAMEKTEVLRISPERSQDLLKDRDFLFLLLENMATSSFSLIKDLIYRSDKSVEKFLAYVLLKYSEDDQLTVKNLSRFSEYMKCSRSNLYIAIGRLEDNGFIKKEDKTLTIINREALKKITET